MGHWEHFAHDADIGIRGVGDSIEESFKFAALALTGVLTDPVLVRPKIAVNIACQALDLELLFVDYINAIIYEMDTKIMLFSQFELNIKGDKLEAVITGEAVDIAKHQPAVDIKGATYTELSVYQLPNGKWVSQCVVDI